MRVRKGAPIVGEKGTPKRGSRLRQTGMEGLEPAAMSQLFPPTATVSAQPLGFAEPPLSPPVASAPQLQHSEPVSIAPPVVDEAEPAPPQRPPLSTDDVAKLPIQALLVRGGHLTLDQLAEALRESVPTGKPVEEIAVERGWVSAEVLSELRAMKAQATGEPVAAAPAPEPVAEAPAAEAPAPVVEVPPAIVEAPAPALAPEPEPEPVVEAPAPVLVSPPVPVEQPPATDPALAPIIFEATEPEVEREVRVVLCLAGGEQVLAETLPESEAEARARQIVHELVRPEPGVWPFYGGRFVRPEAIVSIALLDN